MGLSGLVVLLLALVVVGCGSDEVFDPNESESTRAIREKVRGDMEQDRLRSYGARLADLNAALADAPTATRLGAPEAVAVAAEVEAEASATEVISAGTATPVGAGIDLAAGGPGAELYVRNCSSCHGPGGGGDGPVGKALVPRPARFHDGEYMNALSNEHLVKVISEGGASVGKSPLMAGWSGTMSKQEIHEVIAFVRSLADPPYEGPLP